MGSEKTLTSREHFLDLPTYNSEDISVRNHSTFADKRPTIYAIFEAYLKMKLSRREYDASERFIPLLYESAESF
jgi:hypothetical protein